MSSCRLVGTGFPLLYESLPESCNLSPPHRTIAHPSEITGRTAIDLTFCRLSRALSKTLFYPFHLPLKWIAPPPCNVRSYKCNCEKCKSKAAQWKYESLMNITQNYANAVNWKFFFQNHRIPELAGSMSCVDIVTATWHCHFSWWTERAVSFDRISFTKCVFPIKCGLQDSIPQIKCNQFAWKW